MVQASATCAIVAPCFFATSSILQLTSVRSASPTFARLHIPANNILAARVSVKVSIRLQEVSSGPGCLFCVHRTSYGSSGEWTPRDGTDSKVLSIVQKTCKSEIEE